MIADQSQAAQISGVSPSGVSVLMVCLSGVGALANGVVCSVGLTVVVPAADCVCPPPVWTPIVVKKIKSVR